MMGPSRRHPPCTGRFHRCTPWRPSMKVGSRYARPRSAVLSLIDRMRDEDEVSLVTYSTATQVIQPLARVRDVRTALHTAVPTIEAGGGTMIPSGLAAGAETLSAAETGYVRRVVLV